MAPGSMTTPADQTSFENLPWHQATINYVMGLTEQNLLPNALAITAAQGWGHTELLESIARQLIILGSSDSSKPGPAIEDWAHPDFRWVEPDGASISVDQIRMINNFAVQTPQIAPRKVVALCDAHLMNSNAANALLKTLEEPPPNTHIILATPYWGKITPTIRSRCQRLQINQDQQAALKWLAEQHSVVDSQAYKLAGNAPLSAYHAFTSAQERGRSQTGTDQTDDIGRWLLNVAQAPVADSVDDIMQDAPVEFLSRWYRRLILAMHDCPLRDINAQDTPAITPTSSENSPELHNFVEALIATRRQIETSPSANTKLLLEALLVQWRRYLKS